MGYDEKELLEKAKDGDIDSFEILIQGVKTKAYQIAVSYLKDEEDAKDALQDSLLKIYRNLPRFNGDSQFHTWVYRVVVNTCLDMIKKNKRIREKNIPLVSYTEEGEFFDVSSEIRDDAYHPEQKALQKENREIILVCLKQLSDPLREVIIMRDIQGFSYGEIAEILAISEGTVKSRLSRARQAMKELFLNCMEQK